MITPRIDRFPRDTLYDHTTEQVDSVAIPFIFLQEYEGFREGIDLIRGVIRQVYKRNNRRMIEAYYGYATGVDIRGTLEHFPNIPKGIILSLSD